jgi:hypothetical protein
MNLLPSQNENLCLYLYNVQHCAQLILSLFLAVSCYLKLNVASLIPFISMKLFQYNSLFTSAIHNFRVWCYYLVMN